MKNRAFLSLLISFLLISPFAVAEDNPSTTPGYMLVLGAFKNLGMQSEYSGISYGRLHANGYTGSIFGMPGENMQLLEGSWNPGPFVLVQFESEANVKQYWWDDEHHAAWKVVKPTTALDIFKFDGAPGSAGKLSAMTKQNTAAYLVFLKGKITDKETYNKEYIPFAGGVFQKYGARSVLSSSREQTELLNGSELDGWISVAEFESSEKLTEFLTSKEYTNLSEVRKATGEWSVLRIDPRDWAAVAR